ncbi:flagellar type III secretion system pore protein FliP [Lysobacter gummosus]|jgi:flagellar biosynthetic protein FliP|uniref:Flagellar biosynthetic protein FliP n=1 Tax=Lysobacter gummosus TaxID=262324 RepID=A0ABY3X8U8_9GAMM|nr:flagellar type III secretion system pore protein FliP [Lysobacter gummosus]ALN93536.1 flagellar biosynthetic protein FliP [Lysobacter gummosus]UNP28984.1 flagellar type III secretion system pore protein FliP [Lysobacter gummosus]
MKSFLLRHRRWLLLSLLLAVFAAASAMAATPPPDPFTQQGGVLTALKGGTSESVRIATVLTLLSIVPALVISMTAFIRIIIVLSMIRHAFGMPETPPTPVLISLGLLLTVFTMLPTLEKINTQAYQPFMSGQMSLDVALEKGAGPAKEFMLRQVREDELKVMYEISGKPLPDSPEQVSLLQLTSAFILNELRVAFQIGFVILLPFLLIDLVVSSVLLSLGMLMVPPATISLPLKVLMFVLVDGWSLILQGVILSFK